MKSGQTEIINKNGLHARPAASLVRLANEYKSKIICKKGHASANAKNIMDVLMLAATKGTRLTVITEGDDEAQALEAVIKLIDNRFDEKE